MNPSDWIKLLLEFIYSSSPNSNKPSSSPEYLLPLIVLKGKVGLSQPLLVGATGREGDTVIGRFGIIRKEASFNFLLSLGNDLLLPQVNGLGKKGPRLGFYPEVRE